MLTIRLSVGGLRLEILVGDEVIGRGWGVAVDIIHLNLCL